MTEAVCSNVADLLYDHCPKTDGPIARETWRANWKPVFDHAKALSARYDAARAKHCIDAYRNAWSRCKDHKVEHYHLDLECLGLFSRPDATSGANEPCEFSMDCKVSENGPLSCSTSSGQTGFCQKRSTATRGGLCGTSTASGRIDCADDTFCSGDGRCAARRSLGDDCNTTNADVCQISAVCDETGTKRCQSALPFGNACTEKNECENYSCVNGRCAPSPDLPALTLYCDS